MSRVPRPALRNDKLFIAFDYFLKGKITVKKIITVVGARPQFIKASALSRAIKLINKSKKSIKEIFVHTGQHYDYIMDRVFFEELDLPKPDYHLGIGSHSHGKQTAMMLERIEEVLEKEEPDLVMVYGDTNSTLAGALAGSKLNIPIAHIEAGLRSYKLSMPEEINRILTDHISKFLFCPTKQAVKNLEREGIKDGKERCVNNVGDVMYDSILYYSKIAEKKSAIPTHITHQYYLVTIHRAENTESLEKLKSILKALNDIGENSQIIFPVHPRTKKVINRYHLLNETTNIMMIEPVSYLNMLMLEKNADIIFTDSGGVQKEAFWFGVPCITLRDETEWVETVKSGWNILVGANTQKIIDGLEFLKKKKLNKNRKDFFGDGRAGEKIVNILNKSL